MQSILVNKRITKNKILPISFLSEKENINEFIIYADNILEGITLLNDLTLDDDHLKFYGVIYEPIDQPIYIFQDGYERFYAIKICGSYEKWKLPKEVAEIKNYMDLPDYIIYSIQKQRVIVAGENTETASVGNSQWQREGRKIAAAKIKVPFIYQTFYSGRDESQKAIREPSSLQVYNHLVYSIRYKVPSFVCYLENNFDNSKTRDREKADGQKLFYDYIKILLLNSIDNSFLSLKKVIEVRFYQHMLDYLAEIKYSDLKKKDAKSRLYKDFLCLPNLIYNSLLNSAEVFSEDLVQYLYEESKLKEKEFIEKYPLLAFEENRFKNWTSYKDKNNIKNILSYMDRYGCVPKTYVGRSAKVGLANLRCCKEFLCAKFDEQQEKISSILNEDIYHDVLLIPLRIHKKSKGKLTFAPDPESGEIVAFSELFSKDINGNKKRPVVGYCTVQTPEDFSIGKKEGTKLYKALAEYVDIIVLNDNQIIFDLNNSYNFEDFIPTKIREVFPQSTTEEMAIVSTYLNQSTIKSDWELCFIHTHHSSWQQLVIHKGAAAIQQKIDRVSTKVDLIMQQQNLFMIAEGKNDYFAIIRDKKIKKAMIWTSEKINALYKDENEQFDAFVYNLNTDPKKDPEYYISLEKEKVVGAMVRGHFSNIAHHDSFVVIIVYLNEKGQTGFKLVYSPNFDTTIKERLDKEFNQ